MTFVHAEKNVNTALSDGEAERIIRILDGNPYHLISSGAPSCGFNPDISLKVGSRIYAVACDACNTVLDCGSQRYFSVSKKNMEYLHSLFEKYGGYFPCI